MMGFLLLILLAAAFLLIGRWRRTPPITAEPACGRCHYPVRHLTTSTCPECGSDLNVVGIVRPQPNHPLTLAAQLGGVAMLILLAIVTIANTVPLPRLVESQWHTVMSPTDRTLPYAFHLIAQEREWRIIAPNQLMSRPTNPAVTSGRVCVELMQRGVAGHRVDIDLEAPAYTVVAPGPTETRTAGTFDGDAAAAWLRALPVAIPADQVQPQADILAKVIALRLDTEAVQQFIDSLWSAEPNAVTLFRPTAGISGGGNRSDRFLLAAALVLGMWVWLAYARWAIRSPRLA